MTFNLILKLHTGGVYHYRYVQLLSFIKITINYSSNTIFYDIQCMSKILILNVYILFYRNSRKKQYVVWERSFNFWHNWGSIFRYLYLGYNVCKNYNETIA